MVGVGCAVSSPASSLDPAFFLRVEKPRLSMPGTMDQEYMGNFEELKSLEAAWPVIISTTPPPFAAGPFPGPHNCSFRPDLDISIALGKLSGHKPLAMVTRRAKRTRTRRKGSSGGGGGPGAGRASCEILPLFSEPSNALKIKTWP